MNIRAVVDLKKGDLFGASYHGDKVDLWCRVRGTRRGKLIATVINGGWGLSYDRSTGKACDKRRTNTIVFTSELPKELLSELKYGEAIYFMNSVLTQNRLPVLSS